MKYIVGLFLLFSGVLYAEQSTKVTLLPGSDPLPPAVEALMIKTANAKCADAVGTFAEALEIYYHAADNTASVGVQCADPNNKSNRRVRT